MSSDDTGGYNVQQPWKGTPPLPSAAPDLFAGLVVRRCFAYLVDVIAIALLGLGLGFALSVIGVLSFGLLSPLAVIIMALWPLTYHSFFIAARGATPGMRLFDLELRDWSGKPVELVQSIFLVVLFYVSIGLTAWLILVVVLFNARGRALHDILAGTLVIRRRS